MGYVEAFEEGKVQVKKVRAQESLLTQLVAAERLSHLGYDVVVLQTQRRLEKGRLSLQLSLDGKVYAFASRANLRLFQQQPALYQHV